MLCREQEHCCVCSSSPSACVVFPSESTEPQGVPSPPHSTFSPPLFTCCCLVAKPCLNFVTPWTVACQAPMSLEFPRQEYWNELPFPSSRYLPNPSIESKFPAGRFFTTKPPGKPHMYLYKYPKGSLTKQSPQSSPFPLCFQCLPLFSIAYGNHQSVFCLCFCLSQNVISPESYSE